MSGRVVFRLFFDFEKEERWLNEMAASGMALVGCRWGLYRFEAGEPGRWIYRIELLSRGPRHPASVEERRFLTEAGVEVVAGFSRWVYVRRPAAQGPFDLFTDLDSRIGHYKRVLTLLATLTAAMASVVAAEIVLADGGWISGLATAVAATGATLLAIHTMRLARRVNRLKELRQLYD